ncbi:MAG: hypothetical protein KDK70_02905 [Myxococcales bacterium]|nr:hypothetical protein [Myxococcales bacterium]
MSRWIVVALALVGLGCGGDDAADPMMMMEPDEAAPSFVSYHALSEVEHIEPMPAGYALLGRRGLVAYDDDDQTQWELDPAGAPLTLGLAADGSALRMAVAGEAEALGSVRVDRVDLDGAVAESFALVDPAGPLDQPTVVLREDGGAWIHGGQWPFFWQGRMFPDGTIEVVRPEAEERRALLAAKDDEAYALRSTWTTDVGVPELVELQRLDAEGTPLWSVTVHDGSHDATGAFELGGTLGPDGQGGVLVMTRRSNQTDPEKTVIRRYDAEGRLVWTQAEPPTGLGSPRTLARPGLGGGSVWIDESDGGNQLVVRLVDPSGETTAEGRFDGDHTPITDVTFIGDVLHVLTHDGLTRIYVPPQEIPPVM